MIRHKPHSMVRELAEDTTVGIKVVSSSRTDAQTIRGQLTPSGSQSTYEVWGLELARPHIFLCDVTNHGSIKDGDYLRDSETGIRYLIKGIRRWSALPGVNALEILLEGLAG